MTDRIAEEGAVAEPPGDGAGTRRRLARSTAIFSLATGLSRVLGLVREIVARSYFGVRGPINAFEVAFLVPNTVRALVADAALSSAFVPVFSELLEKGERKRAWRVASSLFWLMLLGLTGITALFMLLAPWIMLPFGYTGDELDLAVGLSRVLFPIVILLGVSGIVVGILNSYDHFTVPALSPVVWNLAIIAGLVIGVPRADSTESELYVYAFSILIGTIIQVALPIPWLRGRDDRLHMVLDWRDPAVVRVLKLMFPVTLGLGLINFNAAIVAAIGAQLVDKDIAPSAVNAAFRLYMLPQGMFSVAIATVLFPSLSRLAARGDIDGFRRTTGVGLRLIGFMLVPASVICAVLAEPIVRIVYERGEFTPDQTPVVAGALAAFSVGLAFNGAMLMLNRSFFSMQSNWLPTAVAAGNLVLNTVLALALSAVGVWGLSLSISLANVAGTAALLFLFRRRIGRIDFHETGSANLRFLLASIPMAIVSFGLWYVLDDALGRSFAGQAISLGVALASAGAVYLGACKLLQVRELGTLRELRKSG